MSVILLITRYVPSASAASALPSKLAGDVIQAIENMVRIIVAHGRIDWERNAAFEVVVRNRELAGSISPSVLVVGVVMQRDKMDGSSDASLPKLLNNLVPMNAQYRRFNQNHVQVPGVLDVGEHGWNAESV
jgi:hypothetical protein